jgi:hypothetical protein
MNSWVDVTSKILSKFFTNFRNFEQWNQIYSQENSITFIWLWNANIETKGYKKTEDRRDDIHESNSRIQFIRSQKKWRFLQQLKAEPVKKKLAQYKQKLLRSVSRMESTGYPK